MVKPSWQNSAFLNYNDSFFNGIQGLICICKMRTANNTYIITNAAIFINDRILNITIVTNTQLRNSHFFIMLNFIQRFKIIITHQISADQGCIDANT